MVGVRMKLKNIGQLPLPPRRAADYFAKMEFEADAIDSAYRRCPAPELMEEPRTFSELQRTIVFSR